MSDKKVNSPCIHLDNSYKVQHYCLHVYKTHMTSNKKLMLEIYHDIGRFAVSVLFGAIWGILHIELLVTPSSRVILVCFLCVRYPVHPSTIAVNCKTANIIQDWCFIILHTIQSHLISERLLLAGFESHQFNFKPFSATTWEDLQKNCSQKCYHRLMIIN